MEEETGALINSLKWDERECGEVERGQDERGKEDIGHWAPGCQDAVSHTSSVSYLDSGEMHKS